MTLRTYTVLLALRFLMIRTSPFAGEDSSGDPTDMTRAQRESLKYLDSHQKSVR